MSEIKQTNFRISSASANAFRAFCEEQGINQAQGFDYLLDILALDKAKAAVQSRETEITNFEQHAKALVSAYLHSLELNENAEARIRDQFTSQLESQSRTIADYQGQVTELQQQLEQALDLAESLKEDFVTAQSNLTETEKQRNTLESDLASLKAEKETQLADKDRIIAMLSAKLADAETKAGDYDTLQGRVNALQADLTAAEQTIKDNAKDAEIALERAVREAERGLEAEHRQETARMQSQITELLQTIAETERTANEQIRALERENAGLRETLAANKREK